MKEETKTPIQKWMLWLIPIAFPLSAIAMTMLWKEQWLPNWPTEEAIWRGIDPYPVDGKLWGKLGWIYHWLKNLTTEIIRADCEFWGKFLLFCLAVALYF